MRPDAAADAVNARSPGCQEGQAPWGTDVEPHDVRSRPTAGWRIQQRARLGRRGWASGTGSEVCRSSLGGSQIHHGPGLSERQRSGFVGMFLDRGRGCALSSLAICSEGYVPVPFLGQPDGVRDLLCRRGRVEAVQRAQQPS